MFDIQVIIDQKLSPGKLTWVIAANLFLVASIRHGCPGEEAEHAMVLDTYDQERDVLVFKNTYDDPNDGLTKNFEIERTGPNAPRELYFVHIEIQDMNNLPSQREREAIRRAGSGRGMFSRIESG